MEALLKRGIAAAESGIYAMPVGIAHVFWACANLHTSTRQVRPPSVRPRTVCLEQRSAPDACRAESCDVCGPPAVHFGAFVVRHLVCCARAASLDICVLYTVCVPDLLLRYYSMVMGSCAISFWRPWQGTSLTWRWTK